MNRENHIVYVSEGNLRINFQNTIINEKNIYILEGVISKHLGYCWSFFDIFIVLRPLLMCSRTKKTCLASVKRVLWIVSHFVFSGLFTDFAKVKTPVHYWRPQSFSRNIILPQKVSKSICICIHRKIRWRHMHNLFRVGLTN